MLASKRSAGSVDERVRDPGDVPHREATVSGVLCATEMAHAGGERPGHQNSGGERGRDEQDRVPHANAQRADRR